MLDESFNLLASLLNDHLNAEFAQTEDLVVVGPLTDTQGKFTDQARNAIAMFVTNIVEDQNPRGGQGPRTTALGQTTYHPPIHLDVYFMLASGFDPSAYGEGLKLLSACLRFFQARPRFTPQTTPQMHAAIQQLSIEIHNIDNSEIGHLWGAFGGRYVPSIQFKMRSVLIDARAVSGVQPVITRIETDLVPSDEGAS